MHTVMGVLAIGAITAGAACANDAGRAGPAPCANVYDEAATLTDATGVVRGFESVERSNLVVMVQNSGVTQTVRIGLDEEEVAETAIPGTPGCQHPPVLSFGFDLEADVVEVEVVVGRHTSTKPVSLSDTRPTWMIVSISNDRLTTSTSDTRPVFG